MPFPVSLWLACWPSRPRWQIAVKHHSASSDETDRCRRRVNCGRTGAIAAPSFAPKKPDRHCHPITGKAARPVCRLRIHAATAAVGYREDRPAPPANRDSAPAPLRTSGSWTEIRLSRRFSSRPRAFAHVKDRSARSSSRGRLCCTKPRCAVSRAATWTAPRYRRTFSRNVRLIERFSQNSSGTTQRSGNASMQCTYSSPSASSSKVR